MGPWIVRPTVTDKSTQRCVNLPPFPSVFQISSKSVEWLGMLGCTWREISSRQSFLCVSFDERIKNYVIIIL